MDICDAEPYLLIAETTSCAESPPCSHMLCYEHVQCFLASTLSPIVAGCRTPERELFCVCPSLPRQFSSLSSSYRKHGTTQSTMSTENSTTALSDSQEDGGGLSGGVIALIVIGVILAVVLIAVLVFFVVKLIRDRRRNHGEYRPQFEELHHAKDLPYLQPPAVEGLI